MPLILLASRVGRVDGGVSPATGQQVKGFIYALGATPRQMLSRPPEFTYRRLDQAVRDAAGHGAQIVGLGAFTKVVGDAGVTVARRASIPVTTGNSLTIAATLETAKLTARRMGWADLSHAKAMVVGATGSIGSVCPRLLAAAPRHPLHWTELVGGDVSMTMPYPWQVRFNASGIVPEPRMEVPVDAGLIEDLLQFIPDFRRAYEPDGLAPEDFEGYGAGARTLRTFSSVPRRAIGC